MVRPDIFPTCLRQCSFGACTKAINMTLVSQSVEINYMLKNKNGVEAFSNVCSMQFAAFQSTRREYDKINNLIAIYFKIVARKDAEPVD